MSDSLQPSAPLDREQRHDKRFMTVLAVDLDGTEAWTRDVSATGVYFETRDARPLGSLVNFLLEVSISGERLNLICEGEVVRVDSRPDGKVGIAARLRASFFASDGDTKASRSTALSLLVDTKTAPHAPSI